MSGPEEPVAASITISPEPVPALPVGETVQLTATVRTSAGTPLPQATVTWASSDTLTATVSATGLVTSRRAGSATITASTRANTTTVTRSITLTTASGVPGRVTLTPATPPPLGAGDSLRLSAAVRTSSGVALPDAPVTWRSTDTLIATVSSSGVVRARRTGTTRISARASATVADSVLITILPPGAPASLTVAVQPAGRWLGSVLDQQPVLQLRDVAGNAVTQPGLTVTAFVQQPAAGVLLGGDLTVRVEQGVARFRNLSISGSATPVTLGFRVGTLSATSNPIALQPFSETASFRIEVTGAEETVIATDQWGMRHTPDGAISFRRDSTGVKFWFPCTASTCFLQGATFDELLPRQVAGAVAPIVFTPSRTPAAFDSAYAGINAVLPAVDGRSLIGIYHAEVHPCDGAFPFVRSLGQARSVDGGLTWTRGGQIARSAAAPPPPGNCTFEVFGPGNPMVTQSRDGRYWYLYFTERVTGRPDEIYLARAPVESDGQPGAWTRYSNGSFSSPLLGGTADPVIRRPDPGSRTIYAATGSVSWNLFLNRYLAVIQAIDGFYYATSSDGILWTPPQLLLSGPSRNADIPVGTTYHAYPTLLSPDQPSQLTTSRTGYLYYAHGAKGGRPPHYMVRRAFVINP